MKLTAAEFSLIRTPKFTTDRELHECWLELKPLIAESSVDFHNKMADLSFEQLLMKDTKVQLTVWKYFNRAKYRATPFGNFASVTPVCYHQNGHGDKTILERLQTVIALKDWSEVKKQFNSLKNVSFVIANNTAYSVGQEIRYISDESGRFELRTVAANPLILFVISRCAGRVRLDDLLLSLREISGMDESYCSNVLRQLLCRRLIFTDNQPNIIGEDYFSRLSKMGGRKHDSYKISLRKLIQNGNSHHAGLSETLKFLYQILPYRPNPQLENFKKRFVKRFDRRAIPLMVALDAETGISYNTSEIAGNLREDDIMDGKESSPKPGTIDFGVFSQQLLNKITVGKTFDLRELPSDVSKRPPMPNSVTVLSQGFDGRRVIKSVGGCTANALLGRFTHAAHEIHSFCRSVARLEQDANPEVIFFDVGYSGEGHNDNVNRRKQIYPFVLPILLWDENEQILDVKDVFLSVRNGELVLWSEKLKKRLIPRISSAYNHQRSDLSLYRFLADLQHQSLMTDLNLNLKERLPGLEEYPRVVIKDIIISPAAWRFNLDQAGRPIFRKLSVEAATELIGDWLIQNNIREKFKFGEGDKTLVFNPGESAEISYFATLLQRTDEDHIYIEEALVAESSEVTDPSGNTFHAEFIDLFTHGLPVYETVSIGSDDYISNKEHFFIPGSGWLYFEIYCHPVRADEILLTVVSPFIDSYKKEMICWYFIRYADPEPHIRLRVKYGDASLFTSMITDLNQMMQPYIMTGLVSDIQVKTYVREISRYSADQIGLLERIFSGSSAFVLKSLSRCISENERRAYVMIYVESILDLVYMELKDRLKFALKMADIFKKEFSLTSEQLSLQNRKFKDFKVVYERRIGKRNHVLTTNTKKDILEVIESRDEISRALVLADIIHMTVNRLFCEHQRKQEAVVYLYLVNILKTRMAIATHVTAP